MTNIGLIHQKKIAEKTLYMSPAGARIMGGMNYEEAYKIIFGIDLKPRLEQLIKEYPNCHNPSSLNTELCKYGYSGIDSLQELLENL